MPPNSQNLELNRALWKMLADHTGHGLRVVLDVDKDFETIVNFTRIGGDEYKDIPFDKYLDDWKS